MTNEKVVNLHTRKNTSTSTSGIAFSESLPDTSLMEEFIIDDEDFDNNMSYNENMPKTMEKNINIFLAAIAVTIAALAIVISIAAWTVDKSIDAVNSNVNSKFDAISTKIEAINQRLDYQEKLNSVQIQRDVAIELKNQKNIK